MGFAQSHPSYSASASMPPVIHPPTVNLNGHGGGLMSPSGNFRMQPTARPPPPGAQGGSILIDACHRALLIVF